MSQAKTGRPLKLNDEVVSKLEEAFRYGASASEACHVSGISRDTFYKHFNKNVEFSDKIERARSWLSTIAKRNVVEAIEAGDLKVSLWLLEKKNTLSTDTVLSEVPVEETQEGLEERRRKIEKFIDTQIRIRDLRKEAAEKRQT